MAQSQRCRRTVVAIAVVIGLVVIAVGSAIVAFFPLLTTDTSYWPM
ncbi:hypothetical protein NY547_06815 [Cnuibacter physcomitrellae]|nr:hypothetical protein [Cnuibacter physcomitrellae]MCS5496946.1 hypothetical protein [Cnuibacter physcomitrellae]